MPKAARALVSCGLIFWLAVFLGGALGRHHHERLAWAELPKSGVLIPLSFGCRALMADSVWVATVQRLGGMDVFKASDTQKRVLAQGAVAASEIDPHFVFPLEAMGVVLSAWMNEAGIARKLFLRGWFLAPQSWKFPFFLGFLSYIHEGDTRRAAEFLKRASIKPNCPAYVTRLTAKLYTLSGNPKEALAFLESVSGLESLAYFRPQIEERKKEVLLTMAFDEIEGALARYRARFGKPPKDIQELKALGLLKRVPKDPFGGDFLIDKQGRVITTSGRTPIKPKTAPRPFGLKPLR